MSTAVGYIDSATLLLSSMRLGDRRATKFLCTSRKPHDDFGSEWNVDGFESVQVPLDVGVL